MAINMKYCKQKSSQVKCRQTPKSYKYQLWYYLVFGIFWQMSKSKFEKHSFMFHFLRNHPFNINTKLTKYNFYSIKNCENE